MKPFANLFTALDETTRTNAKIDALVEYFKAAPPEDAIWTVSFLIGRKPRQIVPTRKLMQWAAEVAAIPAWLFDACYDVVGDLAETITLVLPGGASASDRPLHVWVEQYLLPLRKKDEAIQREAILNAWQQMSNSQCFVWNKLITGGFRVGVSQKLVTRALARFSGIAESVIAHRLMGIWKPHESYFAQILSADTRDADISRPYPFYLAYPLDETFEKLGDVRQWQAEWKWDGIRAQLIKREDQVFVWSRGEELVTDKYPEIQAAAALLPDGTVIDGEILPWKEKRVLHFSELQRRIGRKTVGKKLLHEVPVVLMAYDLLEYEGRDIRAKELAWRDSKLVELLSQISDDRIIHSPKVAGQNWDELAASKDQARGRGVEGLMLKKKNSPYQVGRRRGDWWKWKVDPLTIDAVLIYAQRGHGRRSGLYTDYTFAVWDNGSLVPFAKAYSGLTDEEIRRVDRFIRQNTIERFGPVRSVKPELVFEIAFEDIRRSARHKSGVAVRFPRMARWRTDKTIQDADSLNTIKALINPPLKASHSGL
jgi:DNA ligase-1